VSKGVGGSWPGAEGTGATGGGIFTGGAGCGCGFGWGEGWGGGGGGATAQAASRPAIENNPATLRTGTLRRVENIGNRYVDTAVGSGGGAVPADLLRLVDDVFRQEISW
jgi:hypothetical protein